MEDKYSVIGIDKGFERVISEGMTFEDALKMADASRHLFESVSISQDYNMRKPNQNMLVFSDVEMMLPELKRLLGDRPEELEEQKVFLGNFVTGHNGFIEFMDYLVMMEENGEDVVFVRGLNEHNLLEAARATHQYLGEEKDYRALIDGIEKQLGYSLSELQKRRPKFYHLLNNTYTYFENDKHIFVAGGLDLTRPWRESTPEDIYITSDDFLEKRNNTDKTIVFGNRKVEELNSTVFKKPWINEDQQKIGINGDVRNYGRLIGLSIIEGERYFIGVRHRKRRVKTYAYDVFEL